MDGGGRGQGDPFEEGGGGSAAAAAAAVTQPTITRRPRSESAPLGNSSAAGSWTQTTQKKYGTDIFGAKKTFSKTTTKVVSKADGFRRTSEATGIAANVWGVALKPVPKKKIVMVNVKENSVGGDVNTGLAQFNPLNLKLSSLNLKAGTLNKKPKNLKANGDATDSHLLCNSKATQGTVARKEVK